MSGSYRSIVISLGLYIASFSLIAAPAIDSGALVSVAHVSVPQRVVLMADTEIRNMFRVCGGR